MKNSAPTSRYEHGNYILGILNLIVMIFFSVVTWGLAQKSYELTLNDKSQDLQLQKLTQLCEDSQQQLVKQDEMLQDIRDNLAIANRHYALDARTAKNTRSANFNKVQLALQKILEKLKTVKETSESNSSLMWISFIDEFSNIVASQLENPYLTDREEVLRTWKSMLASCASYKFMIESIQNGTGVVDGLISPGLTPEELDISMGEKFGHFTMKCFQFYNSNTSLILSKENSNLYERR